MPVPFRDVGDIESLGVAGYLKFTSSADGGIVRGALFVVNARGEPLEFTYNQVETPNTFLWRHDDIRRHATRMLTASLLTACARAPHFLLARADEIHSELFISDVQLSIPIARIAAPGRQDDTSPQETSMLVERPEPLDLRWYPSPPAEGTSANGLLQRLIAYGLLLEPFTRAELGLREVYSGELERLS